MFLEEKLREDMKAAMRSGDVFSLGVLRMVLSALRNKSIEKRGKGLDAALTHEEVVAVLGQEAKRRRKAAVLYRDGGREDTALLEEKEAVLIQKYLPVRKTIP